MNPKTNFHFITTLIIVANLSSVLSGCTPRRTIAPASPLPATIAPVRVKSPTATSIPTVAPSRVRPPTATPIPTVAPSRVRPPTATPIPTSLPYPIITLEKGDFYFSIAGQPGFIFSRNLAGYETSQYYQLLDMTGLGGSKLVRVQLDSLGMGYSNTGDVDEAWAKIWEDIFERAASNGIDIMPVFGVWYDWNSGNGYSTWKSNPLNETNGGLSTTPGELFTSDSPTQELWLRWMKTLIERWQGQKNIVAWEIFSEINMVPGTTEPQAIDFVNSATSLIHDADTFHRPVTASLADFGEWSRFYRNDAIDFINIHPYPLSGKLDTAIVTEVHSMLAKYRKPVLIGESGLSFETPDSKPPTLTTADRADIGIKHAIWAAVVSGAMNGRALWWEDGVAIYFPALNLPFIQKYANADLPASNFVRGVEFSSFQPVTSTSSSGVWGAAVGNEKTVLGWFRDAACEPPDWPLQPAISGQTITLSVPGSAAAWKVDYYDTKTGTDVIASAKATRHGRGITLTLPDFTDDIAFKLDAEAGTISTPVAASTTATISGDWSGTISNGSGTFSTQIRLSIQPDCAPGGVCGKFSAPDLPCAGELYLQEINGKTFVFVEQNAAGAASCTSGGYEYLQLRADGTLSYKFSFIPGSAETSTGLLTRP
jgi:hypothetical protein